MALSIARLAASFVLGLAACQAIPASASDRVKPPDRLEAATRVVLPGTGFVVRLDKAVSEPGRPPEDLAKAIAAWLSYEFGLPPLAAPPAIGFASQRRMMGLRYRDVPSDRDGEVVVVAIYDDEARTIWLPDGWSAATPGGSSVLVHEMVHHMQNVAGMKFACPQEREKMAYEAQARWLVLFGSDLETGFGIDPFTRLIKSNCSY